MFQSAPRARARGDANAAGQLTTKNIMFQSAPRARARGDLSRSARESGRTRFNPRPALARGAT